jgi:hypothetical protein
MALAYHAWFVREGAAITLPSVGGASKLLKPSSSDTSWTDGVLGAVETYETDPGTGQPIVIKQGTPGRVQPIDVLRPNSEPVYTIDFQEVDPLMVELVYQTLPLTTASTQFNPGERGATIKGWLKVQGYDETNTLKEQLEVWCEVSLKGPVRRQLGQQVKYSIEARQIFSPLNTGSLS